MGERPPEIWTVGHSNHESARFLELLAMYRINYLIDVRSWPHSRFASWADQDTLPRLLETVGCRYAFFGEALGGRPEDQDCYDPEGHVLYGRVARTDGFRETLARVTRGATQFRLAMMCSEENPESCHRRLLVSKVLVEQGWHVWHIRGDGDATREPGVRPPAEQGLFDTEDDWWRSTASVSQRRQPRSSSGV